MTNHTNSLAPDIDVAVIWLPGFTGDSYEQSDFTVAELLSTCNSLYEQLDRIRSSLGITKLVKCPPKPTVEDISTILNSVTKSYGEDIKKWADWLSSRYKLSRSWNITFQIAIACHVLPVPPDPSISFYIPPEAGIIGMLQASSLANSDATKLLNYPLISLKYQVSINELEEYIIHNKTSIREALSKLPTKPTAGNTEANRLRIGQLAWLLKHNKEELKTWGDIATYITDEYLPAGEVIDEIQALKLSNSFIKQQKLIDV